MPVEFDIEVLSIVRYRMEVVEINSYWTQSIRVSIFFVTAIFSNVEAFGQTITLHDAIERAAKTNPGVEAAWDAFEASRYGVLAAKGKYYPKVDLMMEKGREHTEDPQLLEESYSTESYHLTLTQMLFDGFATRHEVAKQNHVMLTRYYEFKLAAEQVGLDVVGAYLDVLRYRKLLRLAKDNYYQHVLYHRDIDKRVASGLDRGVDLAQAKARLALAEANVLTEATNLKDVSLRYQRLVGVLPSADMRPPKIPYKVIPPQLKKALNIAFISNPELNAAVEKIRSTEADFKGKSAPMAPRLDLRLRKQIDNNTRGVFGEYDEQAIELVLSYNLYRGGGDKARRRQAKYLLYEATDERDHVCREVRQSVSIGYNNIRSKARLIELLKQNKDSTSKVRVAYRNQFDVGQRTLLDLLDTENEYFEVNRRLMNAESDAILAQAQTMAGMGLLLKSMNVKVGNTNKEYRLDLERESSLSEICPPEVLNMEDIDLRAGSPFTIDSLLNSEVSEVSEVMPTGVVAETKLKGFDVKFESNSVELTEDIRKQVSCAAVVLCENPKLKGTVEGHTDSMGSNEYNQRLSQARAENLRNALIAECASARQRLTRIGYGELRPKASNDTEYGRAANRRTELVLVPTLDTSREYTTFEFSCSKTDIVGD